MLSEKTAKEVFSNNSTGLNLPSISFEKKDFNNEINIVDLVLMSKMENSKSEIRRLIKSNGIRINNKTITDDKFLINEMFNKDNFLKISIGKKRHLKIKLN